MPTTRATKEVATHLGVSVGTMRNWSDQYADFLSETARPGHLPERRFTDHDLTVLTYIKQLRSEGLQAEQIRARLEEITLTTGEIITQQTTTEADKPQQATISAASLAPLDAPDAHSATPAVFMALQAMQTQIDGLQQASKANQQEQRHAIYYMGIGFIGACLMFLLLIGLALLYTK